MKKAIIIFLLTGQCFCSPAQENIPETPKQLVTREDYLQKSKAQRTGAIVLISAGGAVVITGMAVALNDLSEDLGNLFNTNYEDNNNEALATGLIIAGGAAMLGSIALFKSANKLKRKALTISFRHERAAQIKSSILSYRSVPSFTLQISL